MVAMKLYNPTLYCVVHFGQQADNIAGAKTSMHGGHSYIALDDILSPQAEDMIDDIIDQLDDDGVMWRPNP